MRGPEDLIQVDVTLHSRISLDRERIVDDPAWAAIVDKLDLNDPEQLDQALRMYLNSYIQRQQLFGGSVIFMPSTNGPADITLRDMEVVNGTGNGSSIGNAARSCGN